MANLGIQVSVGAFHQASWPGAGDVDDCWVVADLQGIHAVAPWIGLATVPAYREAAGNPDRPGPTGGTIAQSLRAIRTLYPGLSVEALTAAPFATFVAKVKSGRPASLELLAGALPPALRFGFAGVHRILVFWTGTEWRGLNPLQPAHARPFVITQDELKAAVLANAPTVHAILFPGVRDAFRIHPLLVDATAQVVATAVAQERARAAAIAANLAADATSAADRIQAGT